MPICRDCNKEYITGIQTIQTKRNTEIHICNECMKKYQRKEANSAKHNK